MALFRTFFIGFALSMLVFRAQGQIKNFTTDEQSTPPSSLPCIALDSVSNTSTPSDIYTGIVKCLDEKNYTRAARLFAIAGVFGAYDRLRVKDKSSHQVLRVIQIEAFDRTSKKRKALLFAEMKKQLAEGSSNLQNICDTISKIGEPTYHPYYMINHGLSAFNESKESAIVEDFNNLEAWESALNSYLHCN